MIYYLGLGSNVGDSMAFFKTTVGRLEKMGHIKKKSSIYKTEPFGDKNQNDFLNAVIEFEFDDLPTVLLEKIKNIEIEVGRKRTYKWGPREIDIDIIDSVGPAVKESQLNIPHEQMANRNFVLIPLSEINPHYKSRDGKAIQKLVMNIKDSGKIERINRAW